MVSRTVLVMAYCCLVAFTDGRVTASKENLVISSPMGLPAASVLGAMASRTLVCMLVISACSLAALASPRGVTTTTDPSPQSSTKSDSTVPHTELSSLFVHPFYKTSPKPSRTDGQPSNGEGPGSSNPRPLPPRSPLPRRYRPRFGLGRPALSKGLYPSFQVYSANEGRGAHQGEASGLDSKTASLDKDQYSKSSKDIHNSGTRDSKDPSPVPPVSPEPRVNGTLAATTNGTADEDASGVTAMVLSESTIWTLALCATMIVAAVAFFAVVLAVCRCRQQRERRKRFMKTHKNIRVMQNMVKIAKRRQREAMIGQGPFARTSAP
ncbi:uncharacterized protein LOC119401577 [Rhipicephalus sanguineus]|uniref:uncharacterized protein LOC119401577 n=1 Tax=Rhipicephalus sanguineus TaxID=34632 RepID=UPI00189432B6|nr:uncharacterized protein LOC119401577 [Rhipicephalus sanguineus]